MIQQVYPVPVKIPFEANTPKELDLPTDGFITHIDLKMKLNVTTDATSGGTPNEDALARILKRVEVYSGEKWFYACRDGRFIKYNNFYEYGDVSEDALPTAAGVTQDVLALYRIHLGLEYSDNFDPTVVIPAEELNDLKMSVLWGAASDLGSGYTINSGEIEVILYRLLLESGEKPEDIFIEGYVEPRSNVIDAPIDDVVSDLGFQKNLPIGNVIRRIWLLIVDSNDNKSNTDVTEVGVKDENRNVWITRNSLDALRYTDKLQYRLKSLVDGFTVIDGEELSGIPLGLDTSEGFKVGDLKLGFTTTTTGGRIKAVIEQLFA